MAKNGMWDSHIIALLRHALAGSGTAHADRLLTCRLTSPVLPPACSLPSASSFMRRVCLRRLQGLPMNGETSTVGIYGAVIALFALLTAWPAPCCNNPAFAEIVPPAQRNLIYAFDRCFEGGWVGGLAGWLAGAWRL